MRRLFTTIILCLAAVCLPACQPNPDKNSAEVFFVFVNRNVNALEIDAFSRPESVGRSGDQPVSVAASAIGRVYLYWSVSFVPWNEETKPDEDSRYASEWVRPGNPLVEENILNAYRKDKVDSFERIEYREVGIKDIVITSVHEVSFESSEAEQQVIQPGEALNDLFEIVCVKLGPDDKGYNNFVINASTLQVVKQADRMSIDDYLSLSPMAPSRLCFRLKESLWESLRDCSIRIEFTDSKVLEVHCP